MYNVGIVARLRAAALGVLIRGGLTILMPIVSLGAGSVNLAWDASTNSGVTGYNIYYGNASHSYPNQTAVGKSLSGVVSGLTPGMTYYFAVTATDSSGNESDFSNEITYLVPGSALPPTISAITDKTGVMNQAVGPISFTVNDSDTAVSSLTISATSGNQTLISDANISLGGNGADRTITLTPNSGATGGATITVSVSDGINTTSTSFNLTVSAPGSQPPTISTIADQNGTYGQTTSPIAFTIGDPDTAVSSLTVSATSGNQTLVPNANIALGGSGANRTITLTPAPSATGGAVITVVVSDGVTTTSTSFNFTVLAPNLPPTISTIANQNGTNNQATGPLSFTIGDPDTAVSSLTVSATSGNQAVIPNANLVLGGSGQSRTIKLTPASGATGSSAITVSVNDGATTTSTSFTFTVYAPSNKPPTISAIANQNGTNNQATGPIAFTIADTDTAVSSLTVSATSANQAVVPNANIVLGGSGQNRTLTLTPAAGATGASTITVSVNDGTTTTSTSFTFSVVAAPNKAPTISAIANQTGTYNQPSSAIPFTVNDPDTTISDLTVSAISGNSSLVPNANIALGGSGQNRTITLTPAANASGVSQITISVSDGTNTATTAFNFTVLAPTNQPPTISSIANQTGNYNQPSSPIAFTINDTDTAISSLVVSATSGNQTLVPNANIALGGSGQSRTITLTPASGATGGSTITVSVNDGTNTVSTSFLFTVQPPAAAPTISAIANQTGFSGQAVVVQFTVNDTDTPLANLTLSAVSGNTTLVPTASVVFGGSGQNRTATITPAANQTGTASITIKVSDGTLTAQSSFSLSVQQPAAMSTSALPKTTTYNGLFYESSAVRLQSAGSVKLTVTTGGKYSGSLQTAAAKYSFTGQFGQFCQGTATILRKGSTPLTLNLTLQPANASQPFSGTLSDGNWTAQVIGQPAVFNIKTNPAPYAGTYTLIIPGGNTSPSFALGNGFASLTVDGNGNIKLAGTLADGTKISQAVGVAGNGSWPFFVPLYKGQGCAIGWISITNRQNDDMNGPINWIKTPNPVNKYYPGGLTIQSSAVGSLFSGSAQGMALGVAKVQLSAPSGSTNGLVMSLKMAKTGVFTGSMLNRTTGKPVAFQGALLQSQNTGYGFMLNTNQSTPVTLMP